MGERFFVTSMAVDALSAPGEVGPRMDVAGSVDMLAFGFDTQEPLVPELAQHLDGLRGRGILRVLDVLFVSKDSHGTFRAHREDTLLDGDTAVSTVSTLWQLLVDGSPESGIVTGGLLGQLRSWEVGIDLDWIERLGLLIEPGTSALLMLVQAKWATDLLDAVLRSGGFPIVFGCLERETMLVVGPDLAATSAAARAAERTAARRGVAILEVLATAHAASPVATQVIAALTRRAPPRRVRDRRGRRRTRGRRARPAALLPGRGRTPTPRSPTSPLCLPGQWRADATREHVR